MTVTAIRPPVATDTGLPEITPPYVQVHTVWTDMPSILVGRERDIYIRGYSRGCLAYTRKHGGPGASGDAAATMTHEVLQSRRLAFEAARQSYAHRAGMAELRRWAKLNSTPERAAEVDAAGKPARKTPVRKSRPVEPVETPAPTTVPAPMPAMTHAAARQSRRELAASRRAAGLSVSGPDWIAAKIAAGIVDSETRELVSVS